MTTGRRPATALVQVRAELQVLQFVGAAQIDRILRGQEQHVS